MYQNTPFPEKKYKKLTRNSSVDEIGERYSLKHAIVVKLYLPYTQFSRNVRLPHQWISTFSAHGDFFDYCALQIFYLLTGQFLVDNYLCQSYGMTSKPRGKNFFIRRPMML